MKLSSHCYTLIILETDAIFKSIFYIKMVHGIINYDGMIIGTILKNFVADVVVIVIDPNTVTCIFLDHAGTVVDVYDYWFGSYYPGIARVFVVVVVVVFVVGEKILQHVVSYYTV